MYLLCVILSTLYKNVFKCFFMYDYMKYTSLKYSKCIIKISLELVCYILAHLNNYTNVLNFGIFLRNILVYYLKYICYKVYFVKTY